MSADRDSREFILRQLGILEFRLTIQDASFRIIASGCCIALVALNTETLPLLGSLSALFVTSVAWTRSWLYVNSRINVLEDMSVRLQDYDSQEQGILKELLIHYRRRDSLFTAGPGSEALGWVLLGSVIGILRILLQS